MRLLIWFKQRTEPNRTDAVVAGNMTICWDARWLYSLTSKFSSSSLATGSVVFWGETRQLLGSHQSFPTKRCLCKTGRLHAVLSTNVVHSVVSTRIPACTLLTAYLTVDPVSYITWHWCQSILQFRVLFHLCVRFIVSGTGNKYRLRGEGLVWLIVAVVCLLAAPRV